MGRLHPDEVTAAEPVVRLLVDSQFPWWSGLPLTRVRSEGTDHHLFRLGADHVVRLPRIEWAAGQAAVDREWLPQLAPFLGVRIPRQEASGVPALGYPFAWSVCDWLPGTPLDRRGAPTDRQVAEDLAALVRDLRSVTLEGGRDAVKHGLRGRPLESKDAATREALAQLPRSANSEALQRIWDRCLAASPARENRWFHGDLMPGNLLFEKGRLTGLIDFGGLGVGDAACDLLGAWYLLNEEERAVFRVALDLDDDEWLRGAGHTLSQAAIYIPYYLDTHPEGAAIALHALQQIRQEL